MDLFLDLVVLTALVSMVIKRIQIGHVLIICAVLFGLFHRVTLSELGKLVFLAATDASTLRVFAALYLINLLEKIMHFSGSQTRLVNGLQKVAGNYRLPMAILPAIIGLLPSPGGAKFSAPLVEKAAAEMDISNETNAAINYYYRHIWEFSLPLYPATLLAVQILEISFGRYLLLTLPFTVLSALCGLFLFKDTPRTEKQNEHIADRPWQGIAEGLAPIVMVMGIVLIFGQEIILSLSLVVVLVMIYYRINISDTILMIRNALELRLFYMVFAAVYLRFVLEHSGRIEQLIGFSEQMGLNPLVISITLPFFLAFLTGITLPGVSIGLPVVLSIAGPENVTSLVLVAIMANYAGLMFSPVHLCLIMSISHFSADFSRTYAKQVIPVVVFVILSFLFSFLF